MPPKIKLINKNNLISISNPLDEKKLHKYYKKNYFFKKKPFFKKSYSKSEIYEKTFNFEIYYYFIKKFFKNKKVQSLELGCGEGFGARYLHDKVNYSGTELDDTAFKLHNKSILKKITFFKGDFLNINELKNKKFDVLILNGIAEHLVDLNKYINFFYSILKKNGLLFIHVPNDFNTIQKYYLKKNKIKDNDAPWVSYDHNHYFNQNSFKKILSKKFEKILIMTDFPIDLFLLNEKTDYYKNKSFGKYANNIRKNFNLIFRNRNNYSMKSYIELCESFSKVGLGRTLLTCFKKI